MLTMTIAYRGDETALGVWTMETADFATNAVIIATNLGRSIL